MKRLFRGRGSATLAVIALAVALAVFVVWFAIMATFTKDSAQFGRMTALSGVYSLVLAALVAAATMTAWAIRGHRETAQHSSEESRNHADDGAVTQDEYGLASATGEEAPASPLGLPRRSLRRLAAGAAVSAAIAIAGLFIAISIDPGSPNAPGRPHPSGASSAASTPPASVTPRASSVRGTLDWTSSTEGDVTSSPVVAAGIIYLSTNYDKVDALNASTGDVVWGVTTAGSVSSSPAVAGGAVYVGTGSGYYGGTGGVYALSTADGHVLWHYTTGEEYGSALAVAGGTVYAASYDGNVYALSTATGDLRWHYTTGDRFGSGLAVAGQTVYVAAGIGLDALDTANGDLRWRYTGDNAGVPVVSGGSVYVGSGDGTVHALSTADGHVLWTHSSGVDVRTSPAVAGGTVYVGSADGKVYALSAATGHVLSSFTTDGPVLSSPVVAGTAVYVSSQAGVYAQDTTSLHLLWTYDPPSPIDVSPAVSGGAVYVAGAQNQTVYALRTAAGP